MQIIDSLSQVLTKLTLFIIFFFKHIKLHCHWGRAVKFGIQNDLRIYDN